MRQLRRVLPDWLSEKYRNAAEKERLHVLRQVQENKDFEYWKDLAGGDVLVKCRQFCWRVHSRVVCPESGVFRQALQYDASYMNTHNARYPTPVELHKYVPERVFSCIYYIYYGRLPAGVQVVGSDSETVSRTAQVLPSLEPIHSSTDTDNPIDKLERTIRVFFTAWDLKVPCCVDPLRRDLKALAAALQKEVLDRTMAYEDCNRLETVIDACLDKMYSHEH
ncbi:hypothetical protein F5X96DRAFT_684664 [Biscogniauxia mediterranea]|nr:hypothetical protein F5X96DRAFT_684664 [Biscogniauxia mediterranea]